MYGLYQAQKAIRAHQRVIVVEGYMDVVALAQKRRGICRRHTRYSYYSVPCAKAAAPVRPGSVLLRRRQTRSEGRLARAGKRAAATAGR